VNDDLNVKLLGVLGVLLLVAGVWSVASMHSAEARGIPQYWLNEDGTVKKSYVGVLKSTPGNQKFTVDQSKKFKDKHLDEMGNKLDKKMQHLQDIHDKLTKAKFKPNPLAKR
jgi:hypothetical protein